MVGCGEKETPTASEKVIQFQPYWKTVWRVSKLRIELPI